MIVIDAEQLYALHMYKSCKAAARPKYPLPLLLNPSCSVYRYMFSALKGHFPAYYYRNLAENHILGRTI